MVCSNLKFGTGHNFPFSAIGYLLLPIVFCQKQAKYVLLILTHHLKRLSLSFQKIIKFGQTELKLWPFKYALFNA